MAELSYEGMWRKARSLVKRKDVDFTYAHTGKTLLHRACEDGCTDIIGFLLSNGASVSLVDSSNKTALYCFCENVRSEGEDERKALDLLCRHGSELDRTVVFDDGLTYTYGNVKPRDSALAVLMRRGMFHLAHILMSHGAKILTSHRTRHLDVEKGKRDASYYRAAKEFLLNSEDIDAREIYGGFSETMLHLAAYHRDREGIEEFLRRGLRFSHAHCDVDLLFSLCRENDVSSIDFLKGKGLSPDILKDKVLELCREDFTAALDCILSENSINAQYKGQNNDSYAYYVEFNGAAKKGIKNETTLLERACREGSLALVSFLLERGADPNLLFPAYIAVKTGNVEILRALIAHGADVNQTGLLAFACREGRIEAVRELLDSGASPNRMTHPDPGNNRSALSFNGKGSYPLHQACRKNLPVMVELLLSRGADMNAVDCNGDTPLFACVRYDRVQCMDVLFSWGADMYQACDRSGETIFHRAAKEGRTEILTCLLQRGFDPNLTEGNSRTGQGLKRKPHTPLALAFENDQFEAAKILIQAGADIDIPLRDTKGEEIEGTPLHFLASKARSFMIRDSSWKGALDLAKTLIKRGLDRHAVNDRGETAIDIIREKSNSLDPITKDFLLWLAEYEKQEQLIHINNDNEKAGFDWDLYDR